MKEKKSERNEKVNLNEQNVRAERKRDMDREEKLSDYPIPRINRRKGAGHYFQQESEIGKENISYRTM